MCVANENIESLLKSTAIVIDNEIYKEDSGIVKLIKELEEAGTIFVKLAEINPEIKAYSNASFIILDWKLSEAETDIELPEEVQVGSEIQSSERKKVLDFIKELTKNFYIPILIFSTESSDIIIRNLIEIGELAHAVETGRIGVFHKSDLAGGKVKEHLTAWLNGNLSAQLYKHLDFIIQETKHKFFNEFDNCNANWPSHVYNTIKDDNPVDLDIEFQEFILSVFSSRIEAKRFEADLNCDCQLSREEILKIYNSIKFVSYEACQPEGIHSGDLYCMLDDKGKKSNYYAINITAPCDLRKKKLLFIKGKAKNGEIDWDKHDTVKVHTIYQILDNDCIIFDFDEYERILIEDKEKVTLKHSKNSRTWQRVGRLLHPYITNLQDRFSHYLIRRGATKVPRY